MLAAVSYRSVSSDKFKPGWHRSGRGRLGQTGFASSSLQAGGEVEPTSTPSYLEKEDHTDLLTWHSFICCVMLVHLGRLQMNLSINIQYI